MSFNYFARFSAACLIASSANLSLSSVYFDCSVSLITTAGLAIALSCSLFVFSIYSVGAGFSGAGLTGATTLFFSEFFELTFSLLPTKLKPPTASV